MAVQGADDHPYMIPELDETKRLQIQACNWQVSKRTFFLASCYHLCPVV